MAKLEYDETGRLLFTQEMRKEYTILIPQMLPVHFGFFAKLLERTGYHVAILNNDGRSVVDSGLKYVHNDACYPALLVIGQIDCRLQLLCKPRLHPERLLRHLRQHIKEQLFQLLRRDRAAICRKSHLDPRLDLLWRDLHSRALQHLLTGTAGRNQSAFSGASAPAALRDTE